MGIVRAIIGIVSLVVLGGAVNLAVLRQTDLDRNFLVLLVAGAGLGVVWLVWRAADGFARGHRLSLHRANTVLASILFLGICILIYAFAKRPDWSWDLTKEGRRELSQQTIQVLRSLTDDVEVDCFFIETGGERTRIARKKTENFLERCQEYTPYLKVAYADPQKEKARLDALGVLRVSEIGTIVLHSGTQTRVIPLSEVNARLEERAFTNALINVAREARPKVCFLAGHMGRDINDTDPQFGGSQFRDWLKKEGYEVEHIALKLGDAAIPPECSVIAINGYSVDLFDHELAALDRFMDQGGRLLILVNPQFGGPPVQKLRPWLARRFGIRLGDDILVSRATSSYKVLATSDFSMLGQFAQNLQPSKEFRGSFNMAHPITRNLDRQFVFEMVRTIDLDEDLPENVTGSVLVRSTPDTWAESDLVSVSASKKIAQNAEEASGPNPMAVAVSQRLTNLPEADEAAPEARVVVIGDADLSRNEVINVEGVNALLLNSVAWLSESEDLIAIRPVSETDPPIYLTTGEERAIAWLASLGPFQAVILIGIVAYLLRRRYR